MHSPLPRERRNMADSPFFEPFSSLVLPRPLKLPFSLPVLLLPVMGATFNRRLRWLGCGGRVWGQGVGAECIYIYVGRGRVHA